MVHFSDESKFNLFRCDGKRFVKCKNGERLSNQCSTKAEIWRGGVMLWGMISFVGVGPIVCFLGNINARIYKDILHQQALLIYAKGKLKFQYS